MVIFYLHVLANKNYMVMKREFKQYVITFSIQSAILNLNEKIIL